MQSQKVKKKLFEMSKNQYKIKSPKSKFKLESQKSQINVLAGKSKKS